MDMLVNIVVTALVTGLVTLLLDKRKERREDRKEAAKKQEAVYEKRPELSITEYADYLSRPGYGVKKKCDMELFLALLSLNMTDSRALQKKRTRRA